MDGVRSLPPPTHQRATVMIAFVVIVLAACYGVLLAALDRPQSRDDRHTERCTVAFLAAGAVTVAAGVTHQVLG